MKKILLMMLGALISVSTFAHDFEYEYKGQILKYSVLDEDAKTVEVAANQSVSGALEIPSKALDGESEYNVTTIGQSAFYNCSSLNMVSIPVGVTSIGNSAFSGCQGMYSVKIPEGIISIGESAFYSCSRLTSITIPESVSSIGSSAFKGCQNLGSVTIPAGVTSIGEQTFYYCLNLRSVTIHGEITSIGKGTFCWCSSLISVDFPESVTSIGEAAFSHCDHLLSIIIPAGITSISERAFYGCSHLTSVIYLANDVFFEGNDDIFDEDNFEKATLYLTENGMRQYSYISPWKYFKNVKVYDPAGIDDVVADFDADKPYEVYNLSGVKVAADCTDGLLPGLYIRRQGSKAEKIIIE